MITEEKVIAVLGALMLFPEYRHLAYTVKVPAKYKTALKVIQNNPTIGYETLVAKLEDKYPTCYMWIDHAPRVFEVENFISEYMKDYIRHETIESVKSLASVAEQLDTEQITDKLRVLLQKSLDLSSPIKSTNEVVNELLREIKRIRNGNGIEIPYFSSIVNDLIGGELIIIAGRPSMGKTALMLNLAERFARKSYHIGFISLEMGSFSLLLRMVQKHWNYSIQRHLKTMSDEEISNLQKQLLEYSELPIYFSDDVTTKLGSVLSTLKYMQTVHDVQIFFVDYLQLIHARGISNRVEELGYITRALKEFAIETRTTIFVGSQLNRNVETRENKVPTLADLRESGAIEQDADTVIMLYRPGYYDENEPPEKLIMKVVKQRNGAIGQIEAHFDLTKQVIENV